MMKEIMRFCLASAAIFLAVNLSVGNVAAAEASTPQQVFDGMRESFNVNDGTYKMGKGKIDNPTVTFITSDKDWVAMSNGKLKGTWAYMTGRLKVHGPQSVARKLDEIFP